MSNTADDFKALSLLLPPCNEDERVQEGLRAFARIQSRVAELERQNKNMTFYSAVELQRKRAERAEARVVELETKHPEIAAAIARGEAENTLLRARVAELEQRMRDEEAAHAVTLLTRDRYHDWADKLAQAIAEHMREDIGEHSSANNPWANALELIDGTFCR